MSQYFIKLLPFASPLYGSRHPYDHDGIVKDVYSVPHGQMQNVGPPNIHYPRDTTTSASYLLKETTSPNK